MKQKIVTGNQLLKWMDKRFPQCFMSVYVEIGTNCLMPEWIWYVWNGGEWSIRVIAWNNQNERLDLRFFCFGGGLLKPFWTDNFHVEVVVVVGRVRCWQIDEGKKDNRFNHTLMMNRMVVDGYDFWRPNKKCKNDPIGSVVLIKEMEEK